MTKSRTATTAAVALLALALAGCGGDPAATADVEQDESAPLEIWVRFAPGSASEATAEALAAAFTEQSGIQTTVIASTDLETKLQQAAAARDLPDIVINDTSQLGNLVSQGLVREVDPAGIAGGDQLSEASWQAAQAADGAHYGVPFNAQSFAMLVRSDWREQVGLPEPQTWDELVELARAFTTEDPDGNGEDDTYGMNVVGATQRGYISWFFSSFLWANGGEFLTGGDGAFTPAIDSPNSVAALTWFQGIFCAEGVVLPGATTMDSGTAAEAFASGRVGIYLTGPYNLAGMDDGVGAENVEVIAVPPGPDGGGQAAALAEGENVYLMAGSPNEAGQQQFAEFAASAEGQVIGMNADQEGSIVRLPVNSQVEMSSVRTDPRWQVFAEVYDSGGRYVPSVPNWTPFRQASADTFNTIVSDCSADPQAELAELAETFRQELDDQGVLG